MAKGTLNLLVIDTEVVTPDVSGFGNFNAYFNGKNMVSGDSILITLYQDIETEGSPDKFDSWVVDFDDLVNGVGIDPIPFTIEANQIARFGVTALTGSAVPLNVGWRITNANSGA